MQIRVGIDNNNDGCCIACALQHQDAGPGGRSLLKIDQAS